MPRPLRNTLADGCYHVINRGNGRAVIFHKDADFAAFERVLSLACERHGMRLLAWVLMHNHFHLVLWPRRKGDVGRFMQWLTTCHVRRYHRHYKGTGHVWQGRFKCFPIAPGAHLLTVLRYVERNPVRAGLVKRAQDWMWSSGGSGSFSSARGKRDGEKVPDPFSAQARGSGTFSGRQTAPPGKRARPLSARSLTLDDKPAQPLEYWLERGPTRRPAPWLRFANIEEEAAELARLRACVNRGTPFGKDAWSKTVARKLGLESTLRPRGRPPKRRRQSA